MCVSNEIGENFAPALPSNLVETNLGDPDPSTRWDNDLLRFVKNAPPIVTETKGESPPSSISYSPSVHTPAPLPAPLLPNFKSLTTSTLAIKQAPIDTIVFNNDLISNENMVELLYEDIAGLELANISREDLINGQDVVYSPIANLSSIYKLFNPNNIIAAPSTLTSYFSRFAIDIILRGMNEPYLDENTGDLVIEIDTILDEEEIHTQITSSGTIELVEL